MSRTAPSLGRYNQLTTPENKAKKIPPIRRDLHRIKPIFQNRPLRG